MVSSLRWRSGSFHKVVIGVTVLACLILLTFHASSSSYVRSDHFEYPSPPKPNDVVSPEENQDFLRGLKEMAPNADYHAVPTFRTTNSSKISSMEKTFEVIDEIFRGVQEDGWTQAVARKKKNLLQRLASKGAFVPSGNDVIEKERMKIREELKNYKIHKALNAKDISDLIPAEGGRFIRNMVVTTWRSGSTFLGDVLLTHPATFYQYEPLLDLGIVQARHGELADKAVRNLKNLMYCEYNEMSSLLEYGLHHPWVHNHNKRLYWVCFTFPYFCLDRDFLSAFCKLFPFQSVKTVRLRMNLTETFLEDPKLDIRVLLLVRDPRGTLQSRRHRKWCPPSDDCSNPIRLCDDLVSDFHAAKKLTKMFPGNVRVLRYEDLSLNTYNQTQEVFDFFRLSYVDEIKEFLDTHTKTTIGGHSSTFRDSKVAPVHWRGDLTFDDVNYIQSHCGEAMRLYGYRQAYDADHLLNFDPIGPFKFDVT